MLRVALLCLFASVFGRALAVQLPFKLEANVYSQEGILSNEDRAEWNLGRVPHPDDTDHLVFETVYSLLQHWPNTRMRNGHNIVPGVIPKGTLLYRSAGDNELPPRPDWVSMDPEHAFIFCRDSSPPDFIAGGCWHLTLATTRPLKVVYLDGNSAAKIPYGSLDAQDLLAWGKAGLDVSHGERERIETLCEWGGKFGVDAFIRMEMAFEAMLCNFTSGVSVASLAHLVSRGGVEPMSPSASASFEAVNSGSWHNRFPGETRIQLDLSRLISFYDTQLVPSLVAIRATQERWDHRVANISTSDLAAVKTRLEELLVRPPGPSSGIEWRTLFQVIVDRFAGRLELTRYLLLNSSPTGPVEALDLAVKIQTQLRIMLTPYILLSATPADTSDKTDLDWTIPVYKLCATIHTKFLELELDSMTYSEKLLLRAAQGTSGEICRVVTKMWAAGVYAGIDPSVNTKESPDLGEIREVWAQWADELNQLMGWLDWSVWVKCNPDCGFEEMCYLSTWPAGFPQKGGHGPQRPDSDRPPHRERPTSPEPLTDSASEQMRSVLKPDPDHWMRPQPRCIPRTAPYDTE